MSTEVKITLVNQGDVIQADGSWCIDSLDRDDHKLLKIRQSFKNVAAPGLKAESDCGQTVYRQPQELVVDRDGPAASDSGAIKIGDKFVDYCDIVAAEGIIVKGKNFLVTEVEKQDKMAGHSQGDRAVIARELDANYEIVPNGLTVKFEQCATYMAGQRVYEVEVIGRRKPTFGPFEANP
jgi:hypothetical protein